VGSITHEAIIRNGPAETFAAIAKIAQGQKVVVLATDETGEWLKIEIPGFEQSWIKRQEIRLDNGQTASIPVAEDIPTPQPTPTPGDTVKMYESAISIPTYPWQEFLTPTVDPVTGWDYKQFDAQAYKAEQRSPAPHDYKLVVLENRWLKVNVMPELGGRFYQFIFKPTGSNELYQNPVIKPSPWGPGPQGNGWLAAGGIEWGLPVPEHGYATSEPWGYITLPGTERQSVTVFDKHQNNVHLSVDVTLQPDTAAAFLAFDLKNRSNRTIPTSFWLNAMVAPGPDNTVGPELRFIYPGNKAIMHSTGDDNLPKPNEVFDWPIYQGRDLSRLGNWNHWLGFFMFPQARDDWAAVYDSAADEGLVRIFPHTQMTGLKAFGFGWQNPISPTEYTDDNSAYVEMHGGITATFDKNMPMSPGTSLQWQEIWYPVAGIGGITQADAFGAVHLDHKGDGIHLRIFTIMPVQGDLVVSDKTGKSSTYNVKITPDKPIDITLPNDLQLPLSFSLQTSDGATWQMEWLW